MPAPQLADDYFIYDPAYGFGSPLPPICNASSENHLPPVSPDGGATIWSYPDWLRLIIAPPHDPNWDTTQVDILDQMPWFCRTDLVWLDENWYGSATWLRQRYMRLGGVPMRGDLRITPSGPTLEWLYDGPTVFEWLVCIAVKLEEKDFWNGDPAQPSRAWCWFWTMMENAHLDRGGKRYLEHTVEKLLNREFSPNGAGSIGGYIPKCKFDMRRMAWWGMMQNWSTRAYPVHLDNCGDDWKREDPW